MNKTKNVRIEELEKLEDIILLTDSEILNFTRICLECGCVEHMEYPHEFCNL